MATVLTVGVCPRHDFPEEVKHFIFGEVITDPMDFEGLFHQAYDRLDKLDELPEFSKSYPTDLHIYVSGSTSALIALISAAHGHGYHNKIWLYHYDRATGEYKPQKMEV